MCTTHLTLLLACFTLPWVVCLGDKCNDKTHYPNEHLCCDLCPEGHFVKEDCTHNQQTVCEKCPSGTYNAEATELYRCHSCTKCQHEKSKCIPTRDAVCDCPLGFLCATETCSTCRRIPTCGKGEQLQQTDGNTAKCEPCPDNTYSDREGGNCTALTR
ncbi:tumor necrosis factor receptor superfamily member 14-like [Megalops cyprinoides]|uniref:tumor necrosis factor receptor superfamily member 14-like n=1 Tax=Megalops cyprinoides TaxID=118141 RepID=UPI001863F290|nr:tumor necrosis factor receptor superfamily member 14-like [Megalops cyprinoides]